MKPRDILIALIVATTATIFIDHAGPARAAKINHDASGDVTGIAGLDAGGSTFDIAFIYGGASRLLIPPRPQLSHPTIPATVLC